MVNWSGRANLGEDLKASDLTVNRFNSDHQPIYFQQCANTFNTFFFLCFTTENECMAKRKHLKFIYWPLNYTNYQTYDLLCHLMCGMK